MKIVLGENSDVKRAYDTLSRAANQGGRTEEVEFGFHLVRDHRTLQQRVMVTMCNAILRMAEQKDKGHFDARNEEACTLAQKLREVLRKETYCIEQTATVEDRLSTTEMEVERIQLSFI